MIIGISNRDNSAPEEMAKTPRLMYTIAAIQR
jgi:hypothetical protein